MRKLFLSICVITTTGILLGYALWQVDFDLMISHLAGADYRFTVPFAAVLFVFFLLKVWRWALILTPLGRYTITQVAPSLLIGFAANNVLPAHLGELVRSAIFARRYGLRVSGVLVTQVLERILDILAILILYLAMVPWVDNTSRALEFSVWIAAAAMAGLVGTIFGLLSAPKSLFGLWQSISKRLPASVQAHGMTFLEDTLLALSSVGSISRLFTLSLNSVAQWTVMAIGVWLSLAAFGVVASAPIAIIVLTATVVAATLPNAPGYIGAIQAAFVVALQPFEIDVEVAFAASIFYLVCNWVPVTFLGIVLFLRNHLSDAKPQESTSVTVDPP